MFLTTFLLTRLFFCVFSILINCTIVVFEEYFDMFNLHSLSKTAQALSLWNNNRKTVVSFFSAIVSKSLFTELETPGFRTRYLASYFLQKFVNIKRACILLLILVGILSILIFSVKNREGGFFFA